MTDIIEKWREEFEAYCDSLEHKIPVVKNSDGKYTFLSTRGLFDLWLAARQSLVIELPKPHRNLDGDYYYLEGIKCHFEEQGYRVEIKK